MHGLTLCTTALSTAYHILQDVEVKTSCEHGAARCSSVQLVLVFADAGSRSIEIRHH